MAAILLDHNVSAKLTALFQDRGHWCRTASDAGLSRAKDPNLLLWAANEQYIVVTHDEDDFEMLHRAWRQWSAVWRVEAQHAGIIAVRHTLAWPVNRIAREIDEIVRERGSLVNQFYKYRLPDGWLVEN